jgi:hypothetical protein
VLKYQLGLSVIDQQVGKTGPFQRIERHPVLIGADHILGAVTGQGFACPVPLDYTMVFIDHEMRDRTALQDIIGVYLLERKDIGKIIFSYFYGIFFCHNSFGP